MFAARRPSQSGHGAPCAKCSWKLMKLRLAQLDISSWSANGKKKGRRDNRIGRHAARLTAEALQRNRNAPVGGVVDEVGRLESSSINNPLEFRSGQPVQILYRRLGTALADAVSDIHILRDKSRIS